MIRFLKLEENISLGFGWVDLLVTAINYDFPTIKIIFEWPGKPDGFLSYNGWKTIESKLEFECSIVSNNDIKINISPNISQFLENGVNYKISLYNLNEIELGQIVVHWKGIRSYRNKNERKNIFEQNSDLIIDENISNKPKSSDYLADNSLELLHDQNTSINNSQLDDLHKIENIEPIEFDTKVDANSFSETKIEKVKRSANQVLCKNCGSYTFDTQKKCFWCSNEI
jgi:hypothetical protein